MTAGRAGRQPIVGAALYTFRFCALSVEVEALRFHPKRVSLCRTKNLDQVQASR